MNHLLQIANVRIFPDLGLCACFILHFAVFREFPDLVDEIALVYFVGCVFSCIAVLGNARVFVAMGVR